MCICVFSVFKFSKGQTPLIDREGRGASKGCVEGFPRLSALVASLAPPGDPGLRSSRLSPDLDSGPLGGVLGGWVSGALEPPETVPGYPGLAASGVSLELLGARSIGASWGPFSFWARPRSSMNLGEPLAPARGGLTKPWCWALKNGEA